MASSSTWARCGPAGRCGTLAPRDHQFGIQTPRLVLGRRRRPLPQGIELLLRALGLELDALVDLQQFIDVLLGLWGKAKVKSCPSFGAEIARRGYVRARSAPPYPSSP